MSVIVTITLNCLSGQLLISISLRFFPEVYIVLSFGTYPSVSSLSLTLCVGVYALDETATTHSLFVFCIFFKIFCCGPIFKVFVEFVTILLLFLCFGFLAPRHVASQLPDQGSNLHPLHWKATS